MVNVIIYILLVVHILCSALLTLLVLMQRPKSEGLGAAFGSGMTESMFGAGTSEVLTKMTIWLGSIFIGLTLLLAILYAHRTSSKIHQQLLAPVATETAPATPPSPATTEKTATPVTNPVAPATSTETKAPATTPTPATTTPAPAATPEQPKK